MGELRQLFQDPEPAAKPKQTRKRAEGLRPMPERLTADEYRQLLTLAAEDGRTYEEVVFAGRSVRLWWETRRQMRADWVMVIVNAMRTGWAMRGWEEHQKRTREPIAHARSNPVYRSTKLTPETIEALVARRAEK